MVTFCSLGTTSCLRGWFGFYVLEVKHALLIERLPSSDWLTPKAKSETFFMFAYSLRLFPMFPKTEGETVMVNLFLAMKSSIYADLF